jgi:hypothetical protein
MSILIEGPNGSGKTTFAIEIANRLKVPYIHNDQFTTAIELEKQSHFDYGFIDRGWLSSFIYDSASFSLGIPRHFKISIPRAMSIFVRQPIILLDGIINIDNHKRHSSQTRALLRTAGQLYRVVSIHLHDLAYSGHLQLIRLAHHATLFYFKHHDAASEEVATAVDLLKKRERLVKAPSYIRTQTYEHKGHTHELQDLVDLRIVEDNPLIQPLNYWVDGELTSLDKVVSFQNAELKDEVIKESTHVKSD